PLIWIVSSAACWAFAPSTRIMVRRVSKILCFILLCLFSHKRQLRLLLFFLPGKKSCHVRHFVQHLAFQPVTGNGHDQLSRWRGSWCCQRCRRCLIFKGRPR